ncbi:MAG: type pilus assembly PilZ [Tardiphaga sp.]|nr:type pilus assembly PilZ [Tardiphaga sp.]
MLERRRNYRGRVYYGGRIAFNGRRSTMDCVVRNFSSGGARVDLAHACLLSDEVDFTIDRKGLAFRARMIWRRDDMAGFVFRDPRHIPVAMSADWALRLRASERANKALLRHVEQLRSEY